MESRAQQKKEPVASRHNLRNSKRKAEASPTKGKKSKLPLGERTNTAVLANKNLTGKNVTDTKKTSLLGQKTANTLGKKSTITKSKAVVEGKDKGVKVDKKEISNENPKEANVKVKDSAVKSNEVEKVTDVATLRLNAKNDNKTKEVKARLPEGVIDFDSEGLDDPFQVSEYVWEIFTYYRLRESKFVVAKYLEKQTELNQNMRAILVDWMVEVQESFELNHETLYLAVKLVDLYLTKVTSVKRDKLQLIGATAMFLAAKYDERSPPVIDDFCYICDDAYPQKDVLQMEILMLKTLGYDIGAPLSYRFLRRYARCAKLEMETLTLARYILEMSLADYDFIDVSDSLMASACLLLGLKISGVEDPWTPTLEYYSGYTKDDIFDLCHRLFHMIRTPPQSVKTIRAKYSHKVFYEVAKIALPEELKL